MEIMHGLPVSGSEFKHAFYFMDLIFGGRGGGGVPNLFKLLLFKILQVTSFFKVCRIFKGRTYCIRLYNIYCKWQIDRILQEIVTLVRFVI